MCGVFILVKLFMVFFHQYSQYPNFFYCYSRVVTGIRIQKHGRVFHLQVHQGTLGKRGMVEAGEWVPVQKFDPTDTGVTDGVDYHTLTYERRAIDLDELDSPAGHVLTGVR